MINYGYWQTSTDFNQINNIFQQTLYALIRGYIRQPISRVLSWTAIHLGATLL